MILFSNRENEKSSWGLLTGEKISWSLPTGSLLFISPGRTIREAPPDACISGAEYPESEAL